jgi:hypothetical protein
MNILYASAWVAVPVALGCCAVFAPWWVTVAVVTVLVSAALVFVLRMPSVTP